jgi:hypothetical protein
MRARKSILIAVAAAALAGLNSARPAERHRPAGPQRPPSQVVDRSAEAGPLAAKLDRALGEAARIEAGQPFWIGYAIDRLMDENSHIGTFRGDWSGRGPTIAEVLAGKTGPESVAPAGGDIKRAASAALERIERERKPGKKVLKELGLFLEYAPGKPPALAEVQMSNLDLGFDFEGRPLVWLGKTPEEQSLALIEALYGRNKGHDARKGLVAAAGCHGTPRLVLPFLEKVLTGDGPEELRKDAAFWIGQQNDPGALRLLARTARTDPSEEVREGAVFGISQVELPEAVDELIALARGASERPGVRKQAVFWLGQAASKKSGGILEEIAAGAGELEIQEHALFALAELPDHQGVEALVRLARTHKDARIRKKAVFWLGESEDPRALEAIIAIVKGK